jgi:hypothetical protein
MSGAYRGCIVLSYIALFDDLLAKLAELGKVNKGAKTIYIDASKKKADQEVFESYLMDQLGSTGLISGLDTAFLITLRTLRNKSAHPSGHKPSPEEARFIFYEVVSRFLCQPILSTTQLVDELIERLKNKNFFPTSQINDIKEVVAEEIACLHEEAFSQLVSKLTNEANSSDGNISRNAGFFITGLASLDQEKINNLLQKKIIQAKSDDSDYYLLILRLISANGKLFIGLTKTTITRFRKLFSERIDSVKASVSETKFSHPIAVFSSLRDVLTDKQMIDLFSSELKKLFKEKPYSNYLIDSIIGLPKVGAVYLGCLKENAASSSFYVANRFATEIEYIDEFLSNLASDKDAFEIIVSVLIAADGNAFDAQGLRRTKFAKTPNIKSKAEKYINSDKRKAREYIKEALGLEIKTADFIKEYFGINEDA